MGVPAHAHSESHPGRAAYNLAGIDDEYETMWHDNANEYLRDYSHTKENYNNDGGFLFNTHYYSESDIMYFLFYTLNQMADFHPSHIAAYYSGLYVYDGASKGAIGNNQLPKGTNDVLNEKYSEWTFPVEDITYSWVITNSNPLLGAIQMSYVFHTNLVQVHTTEFMVGACATILYYYLYQSGKLKTKIETATLCTDISGKSKIITAPKAIILKSGFKFDASSNNTLLVETKINNIKSISVKSSSLLEEQLTSTINSKTETSKEFLKQDTFEKIVIYPNPTNGIINISNLKQLSIIRIFNMIGNTIYENRTNQTSIQLNLKNIPKGIYLIHISNGLSTYKQKVEIL
jgi:hypothetical protein